MYNEPIKRYATVESKNKKPGIENILENNKFQYADFINRMKNLRVLSRCLKIYQSNFRSKSTERSQFINPFYFDFTPGEDVPPAAGQSYQLNNNRERAANIAAGLIENYKNSNKGRKALEGYLAGKAIEQLLKAGKNLTLEHIEEIIRKSKDKQFVGENWSDVEDLKDLTRDFSQF